MAENFLSQDWEDRVAGKNCPLDHPRPEYDDYYPVRKLSIATLYLYRNQTYRGYCILIYDKGHATRIDELSADEWSKLAKDIHVAGTAVYRAMQPDHINIASLGMLVPHLHWHIIPRYKDDPRWGGPIWTTDLKDMDKVRLRDNEYEEMAKRINQAMDDR